MAASPQAAAGVSADASTSGTTNGTPSACRLLECEVLQPGGEEAVARRTGSRRSAEKTWMSPVHPSRSSRCGQSVGRRGSCRACPRRRSRAAGSTGACEESNQPVRVHVGVDDDGGDVGRVEFAGPALDLGVPEPVERELRLPRLDPVARQGVAVGGLRVPQRAHAELAVLEHFGVAQHDRVALAAGDADAQAAHEVLPEVEHRAAARGGDDLGDGDLLGGPHGRCGPRDRRQRLGGVGPGVEP